MTGRALLQGVLGAPGADAPRLVYADWLEEHGESERAALIRTQVELARLDEDDPRRDDLERRERGLLAEYRDRWLEPLPAWARKQAVFRRGFVEEVTARAAQFV